MTELLQATPIVRIDQERLRNAIVENKIVVVKGLKGTGKRDAVETELRSLNLSYTCLKKQDYKGHKLGELGWKKWLENPSEVSTLIFDEAEFIENWNLFMESVLTETVPMNCILITSYEPNLEEVFQMALENAGALLHWSPISFYELAQDMGMGKLETKLEEVLIYGSLPAVLNATDKQQSLLEVLTYWQKSQWSFEERINKREQQLKVLKILAVQMGEIVSFNEIGTKVGLDNETVERYVHLFEKAFLIQVVPNFTTGQKYEMKKGMCIYFTDNGLRNALIENYTDMDWRLDADSLWRNWLLIERQKRIAQNNLKKRMFTWRSLTKTSVDLLEVDQNGIQAFQVSWNKKMKKKFPMGFVNCYPQAKQTLINRSTYWSFLSTNK